MDPGDAFATHLHGRLKMMGDPAGGRGYVQDRQDRPQRI